MNGQTRLGSFIEASFNIAIGLVISTIANAIIFPQFGFNPTLEENVTISVIYTVISLVRQYVIRRWFNAKLQSAAKKLAGEG